MGLPSAGHRAIRICVDVNVFTADFLSRRKGGAGGASSKILDMIRDGTCALGPVQLVLSWRMLTTLSIVLERLGVRPAEAWATCELLAAAAEFGPLQEAPAVILGGTGLLPMKDVEDRGVAETALVGNADMLITYDLDDFENGAKSAFRTERLLLKRASRKPVVLVVRCTLRNGFVAALPEAAVGWLLGQTSVPAEVQAILAHPPATPGRARA